MFAALLTALLLFATPADARDPAYSQDATQALTTAYSALTLTGDGDDSRDWRGSSEVGLAFCQLTSISSATQITWFVAIDSAGERAITPEQTDDILDHDSDNTGSISRTLDTLVVGESDNLYIFAKTDAGTATAECRITWR